MAKKSLKVVSKASMKRIHTQPDLSPRALVLACAEGLLGQLILNARLGFSDMTTELPLHQTVQTIAAARGYHHHHEYPVSKKKVKGDFERLDFVFTKLAPKPKKADGSDNFSIAIALEMKVVGRSSRNKPRKVSVDRRIKRQPYKDVTKDISKIRSFLTETVNEHAIPLASGYLMVVNLDIDSGIQWDMAKAGNTKANSVVLLNRYVYTNGPVRKSVTVYEVGV